MLYYKKKIKVDNRGVVQKKGSVELNRNLDFYYLHSGWYPPYLFQ